MLLLIDFDVQHDVQPGVGGQRVAQLAVVHRHAQGVVAEAVYHRRHLALLPEAAGRRATDGAAQFEGENDVLHNIQRRNFD